MSLFSHSNKTLQYNTGVLSALVVNLSEHYVLVTLEKEEI